MPITRMVTLGRAATINASTPQTIIRAIDLLIGLPLRLDDLFFFAMGTCFSHRQPEAIS
jgi:hypothetical protein